MIRGQPPGAADEQGHPVIVPRNTASCLHAGTTRVTHDEEGGMKVSARNVLQGKVKEIKPGVVNTEVIIELTAMPEVVSVITKESAENLPLSTGKRVYALIKASNV